MLLLGFSFELTFRPEQREKSFNASSTQPAGEKFLSSRRTAETFFSRWKAVDRLFLLVESRVDRLIGMTVEIHRLDQGLGLIANLGFSYGWAP